MRGQRRGRGEQQQGPRRQRSGDYLIFLAAFPEGELIQEVQALRERYDPKTASDVAPHVTFAGSYWRDGPATEENETLLIHRLQKHQEEMAPLTLQLGGIRHFGNRVVYLGVRPTEQFRAVRQTLLDILGPDKHRRFTPHLTLAMGLPPEDIEKMLEELRGSRWDTERWQVPVHQLSLMQRGPDDPEWREIAVVQLEGEG